MTRTKEQLRKAIFGKLQGLRRKLHAHGIPCTYARSVLSFDNGGNGFAITYRLPDDQTTLLPQLSVCTAQGTQTFDHLAFEQGLDRLKELFQPQYLGNSQEISSDTHASTNGQASVADIQDSNSNIIAQN